MSIDVIKLAREAKLGAALSHGGPLRVFIEGADWHDELSRFAALVLEEAAKVCDVTPPQPFRPSIEAAHAIRALKPQE